MKKYSSPQKSEIIMRGIFNCKKLIVEAKKCGVDAVKFQTFIPDLYVSNEDKTRIKRLKKFQFPKINLKNYHNSVKK